ncbi:hypothetical protein COO91_00678 [Nostoc flagelliforme CCNUN1]|uniref:Uncharacterized protein n=1 Tax=Nostoc flagelliforme CCNUN1 TaxID=2038116 RepID=A0A2K8SHM3_9NOSO|nr:hypothetical protein COO91_00678 [Nostoc flagelliforme CCNUN1]
MLLDAATALLALIASMDCEDLVSPWLHAVVSSRTHATEIDNFEGSL